MTNLPVAESPRGPILLCAGNDATVAARLAESAAALLADRPVVAVAIWDPPPATSGHDAVMHALYDSYADLRAAVRRAAAEAAGAACEVLDARGLDVTRRVVADGRGAWQPILEVAEELDAALIVAGANDGSARQAGALGREARALAHRARCPLLVLPADHGAASTEAPAIFAYDGSNSAQHAVRAAAGLLRPRPALVASAWPSATYAVGVATLAIPEEVARSGAARLDEAAAREAESQARDAAITLSVAGWSCDIAAIKTDRNVPAAIVLTAEDHDAAVIVTGTRGRSRIAAALLGSTAEGILRRADRPVLLVPPPAQASRAPIDSTRADRGGS
jgi:nucleotide-binding universal stress UspA family protein